MNDVQPIVSKAELYRRLADAGLWPEAQQRSREEIRTRLRAKGLPRRQANEKSWAELAELYPAPTRPAPAPLASYQADLRDEDGSFLDILDWTCSALGWHEEGKPVTRFDAPGPRSWAMYSWAQTDIKSRKEFFSLWASASRRESTGEDESAMAKEVRRQTAELEAMLKELHSLGD